MAFNSPNHSRFGLQPRVLFYCIAAAFLCGFFSRRGRAQEILAPPPPDFSGLSPALRTTGTNQPGEIPPLAAPAREQSLFQLGPVQFKPHFLYRFLYGDGISARPGEQVTTAIQEVCPGILLRLGDRWNLDYTPILRFYSNSHFRDTVDHNAVLSAATVYEDWTIGFSQSYTSSSQPLAETAAQTDEEVYTTGLNLVYQMSSATSLELGVRQYFLFAGQSVPGQFLTDTRSWSSLDWLNYQFSPKIAIAIGAGVGYDNLSVGSDMISEQLQGRIILRPGDKLSFSASGGAEIRQLVDVKSSNLISPLFGLSAQYQLFESTTLGLGANRLVSPSLFLNQLTETTTGSANLPHRIFKKLFLDLSGGYIHTSYRFTIYGFDLAREDDGTYFNARLSASLFKRGSAAVFYQTSDNSSTASAFVFSSTQVGFELGYRF